MKKNPYQMLLDDIIDFCKKIKYRREIAMWYYPKGKLSDGWKIEDLNERVAAAEQLGYDVVLKNTELGLEVKYIEKLPDIPWKWR